MARKRRTQRRRRSNGQFASLADIGSFKKEASLAGSVFGLAALGVLALVLTSRNRA